MSKIAFVIFGTELHGVGGRRIARIARTIEPNTEIFFITPMNQRSLFTYLKPDIKGLCSDIDESIIAEILASYELICFSSMTNTISHVKNICKKIKGINSNCYLLLGGVHATLYPEDAIETFDAICIGEGEKPFKEFLNAFNSMKNWENIKGIWVKTGGGGGVF